MDVSTSATPSLASMKDLVERIQRLSYLEQTDILSIIKQQRIPYSANTNGVFINMRSVDAATYVELVRYMDMWEERRARDIYHTNQPQPGFPLNIHPLSNAPPPPASLSTQWSSSKGITTTNPVDVRHDTLSVPSHPTLNAFLHNIREKPSHKRGSMKFTLARKRYSRQAMPADPFVYAGAAPLAPEEYVV